MKIGVTAATGRLGRIVIEKLKQKIQPVEIVALARSAEKAKELGVEFRPFDYEKPELIRPALQGLDKLLLISVGGLDRRYDKHRNVLEVAREIGIPKVVYTSILHATHSTIDLALAHKNTEELLLESISDFTILRNGWYTENYTDGLVGAVSAGKLLGSAKDGKISSASRADYAEAAVAVLLSDGHRNKTYELAGDTAYTLSDMAAEVAKQTGKKFVYANHPEAEYAKLLIGFGVPAQMANAVAGWDTAVANGDLFDDSHILSKLIGHPTTPMSETVKVVLKNVIVQK